MSVLYQRVPFHECLSNDTMTLRLCPDVSYHRRGKCCMAHRWRLNTGESIFRVCNYAFLGLLGLSTLYPFWFIIQASLTDPTSKMGFFWPTGFFSRNYWLLFTHEGIGQAYLITVLRVITAVPLMILVTIAAAFALTSRPQ